MAGAVAVIALVSALAPAPPAHTWAVVITREIPAGTQLSASDVARVERTAATLADGSLTDVQQAIGRFTVTGLSRNTVLTPSLIVSGAGKAPPGMVLLPINLSDPRAVDLLHVGDRVDVLSLSGQAGKTGVVAANVRVAVVPTSSSSGGLTAGLDNRTGWMVIEIPSEAVVRVSEAAATSKLTVALH